MTGQTCQPSDEFDSKPILKHDAEKVFGESGLTATQAVTLCWKQVELEGGLPFAVRVPNDVTMAADAAQASSEPMSGSRLGAPAGVYACLAKEFMLPNHVTAALDRL